MANENEISVPTIRESLSNLILEAKNLKSVPLHVGNTEIVSASKRLRQLGSHAGYLLNKAENTAKKKAWESMSESAQDNWLSIALDTV